MSSVDRRAFLGMTLGTAAGAASLMAGCGATTPSTTATPETAAANSLRSRIVGKVLRPGDPGYDAEVKGYNLTLERRPGLIVAAAGPADISAAVAYAAAHRMPAAVLATGHQNSVPIERNSMLITTRTLRGVTVDERRKTARVQAGALWQDVVDQSTKAGLAPLNGSTGIVGVVGYTVGGRPESDARPRSRVRGRQCSEYRRGHRRWTAAHGHPDRRSGSVLRHPGR